MSFAFLALAVLVGPCSGAASRIVAASRRAVRGERLAPALPHSALPAQARDSAAPGSAGVEEPAPDFARAYLRADILSARFGTSEQQQLHAAIERSAGEISRELIGQEELIEALHQGLHTYVDGFGRRSGRPPARHIIGLTGTGKSELMRLIERHAGIAMIRIEAQHFAAGSNPADTARNLFYLLKNIVELQRKSKRPMLLFFDEIDKLPEKAQDGRELNEPLIAALNEIVTSGRLRSPWGGEVLDLSQFYVLSGMNFAPSVVSEFSEAALGQKKDYFDFTHADFAKFHEWASRGQGAYAAKAKTLSRLFRDNTVGRQIADIVVSKPLLGDDLDKIARLRLDLATRDFIAAGGAGDRRLSVEPTEQFLRFLRRESDYAPSGARATVNGIDRIVEQLLFHAMRTPGPDPATLASPRKVRLDYDHEAVSVRVTVTPVRRFGALVRDGQAFDLTLGYNPATQTFSAERGAWALEPPRLKALKPRQPRLTRAMIRLARWGKIADKELRAFGRALRETIFDQPEAIAHMEDAMRDYLADPSVPERPRISVFAGFPGTGKSELVFRAGEELELPVARLNLENFSSADAGVVEKFVTELEGKLSEARGAARDGKYILLLEELHTLAELEPVTGAKITRPVMGIVSDLLSEGETKVKIKSGFGEREVVLDIRDARTFVTFNPEDLLSELYADPRLTSLGEVHAVWKDLVQAPDMFQKVMGLIFTRRTISRVESSDLVIFRPLSAKAYRELLRQETEEVVADMFHRDGRNVAAVDVRLTASYLDYLYGEAMVPTEGGRRFRRTVRSLIQGHLRKALAGIPRSSPGATRPLRLTLDFKPASPRRRPRVLATASVGGRQSKLLDFQPRFRFPDVAVRGPLSEDRLEVATHEFGHALSHARMGERFQFVSIVRLAADWEGIVKVDHSELTPAKMTGPSLIASIYDSLGSRALERVIHHPDPLSPAAAALVSRGIKGDARALTQKAWEAAYSVVLDPWGAPFDRSGLKEGEDFLKRTAYVAPVPAEQVDRLGLVLRDMTEYLIRDFLAAHPREWYIERIKSLAGDGLLKEREFYALIGYPHPGDSGHSAAESYSLAEIFGRDAVQPVPAQARAARASRAHSRTGTTASENLRRGVEFFIERIKARLHPELDAAQQGNGSSGAGS